ncbi:sulfotransferase family protein [Bailinhaonella thermotolerans]|uniref:Sulfotransferase n=1 Tax=Bailinhaonella thermotolerans TaxID=1070861 RepID=A0A3A4BWF1_9ACTN|nr:sulfotransferase [Bailinhaonella thermotolerans]RJL35918.1 sulfotransferase [Bailinhaonella thermotolerans]
MTAIRIDDLAAPRFTSDVARMRADLAPMAEAITLEPAALLRAAVEQSGLDRFGDEWFLEPLEVLCASLRTEARLGPMGVVTLWAQLVQALTNRLRVEEEIRRHPEILRVPVERPIVIAGLPRTGTTHLHNLMSADPALRHLPYWESIEPVPPDHERGADPDPRIARAAAVLAAAEGPLPHLRLMHEMWPEHAHEDIQLLALSCASFYFESFAPLPSYRRWLRTADQTPAYAHMRRTLQVLRWLRGGRRWVLKAPGHLEQLRPLMAVFPDAFVVVTHRDPAEIAASLCTMMTYSARLAQESVDAREAGHYWAGRMADLLNGCLADRDALPAGQSVDVRFEDFMADEMGTVRDIYARAGQPFTPGTEAALAAFRREHPRGKHGRVVYDLRDFGLDEAEISRSLSAYRRRFRV